MKNHIAINQLGYPRLGAKQAVISGETELFSLIDSVNNEAVFTAAPKPSIPVETWGERLQKLDFSEVSLSGSFFLRVNVGGTAIRSGVFDIAENPYEGLMKGIERAIFASRCGCDTAVSGNFFTHSACHQKVQGSDRNFSGGFHDGPEYGRNVYSHACFLASLIYSIIISENRYATMKLLDMKSYASTNIITPGIISEVKYGLLWLLKMQDSDGGVFTGIVPNEMPDIVPPDEDRAGYLLQGKSVYSTLAFAGITALASWLFRQSDEKFSEKLKQAAIKAWIAYAEYSDSHVIDFDKEENSAMGNICKDGKCNLSGLRFWALCELYALTGSEDFLNGAKQSVPHDVCSFSPDNVSGYGLLSIFLHPDGGDLDLRRKIMFAMRVKADNLTSISGKNFVTDDSFKCGSNMKIMSDAICLYAASTVLKCSDYREFAARNLNYIMGANPLNKCFVTGFGHNPVIRPHHLLSAAYPDTPPLPGLAVCGANASRLSDNYLRWQLPRATPPAKSYGDAPSSRTTNAATLPATALLYFMISVV
jgi:endoglucanase